MTALVAARIAARGVRMARLPRAAQTLACCVTEHEHERAGDALRLLAEASETLGQSLDFGETMDQLVRVLVPRVADWCMVCVVRDGAIKLAAVSHVDPAKKRLFERLPPMRLCEAGEIGRLVESGESVFLPDVTEENVVPGGVVPLPPGVFGELTAEVLRDLGVRSILMVPLAARGQALGFLVLARTHAARRYRPDDLHLAEDLGRRCAIAVDNALLYEAAQQAIQSRDEFLSIASHELRTPITSLLLHLELLERTARNEHGRESRGLEITVKQAKRLSSLIDALLDVSRIRLGRISLARADFDLVELMHEVAERIEPEATRAGCTIAVRAEGPVTGAWDRFRLDQVLSNLLTNAVKFAPRTTIDACIEAVGQQGDRARIVVRDRGTGMSPADQRRIFERFERASSIRHYGGLGLGLYISRQIVEAHGGTIHVVSAPGEGTTFTVELPLRPPPLPSLVPGRTSPPAEPRGRMMD